MRTLIVAEAGVNHNGDLSLAKRLIDVAADAEAALRWANSYTFVINKTLSPGIGVLDNYLR